MIRNHVRLLVWFAVLVFTVLLCLPANAQTLPSETPPKFEPTNEGFDYVRREVMIPMRDGVKLHTVILAPKGARTAPILLTRRPYSATELTSHWARSHPGPIRTG